MLGVGEQDKHLSEQPFLTGIQGAGAGIQRNKSDYCGFEKQQSFNENGEIFQNSVAMATSSFFGVLLL